MKSFLMSIVVATGIAACAKTDVTPFIDDSNPDWIRLTTPSGGEALNVAGNLDSTLFVATMFKVYRTTDQGRSWTLVRDRNQGPNGVMIRNDTVFLLANRGGNFGPNVRAASNVVEFSIDAGKTWQKYWYRTSGEPAKILNQAEAPDGSLYVIEEHSTPINSVSAYVNPSTLVRQVNNETKQVAIPFRHTINAIELDSKNRLYVAVSGEHIPETNRIYCCDHDKPAYVYASKNGLP